MDFLLFLEAALANLLVCSGISFAILRGFRATDMQENRAAKRMMSLQIELLSKKVSCLEKR